MPPLLDYLWTVYAGGGVISGLSILFLWSMWFLFLLLPVSYCSDYYSFVVEFEIRKCDAPGFVLLSHGCFHYSASFVALDKFGDFFFLYL